MIKQKMVETKLSPPNEDKMILLVVHTYVLSINLSSSARKKLYKFNTFSVENKFLDNTIPITVFCAFSNKIFNWDPIFTILDSI